MAKFTEEEKRHIRECLLIKGKELFAKYGFAKTSVDELVEACGIAKGSFYKFFSSKEELFYRIIKQEEVIRDRLLAELLREDLSPKELIASFFRTSLSLVEENPFLQYMFQDGEYQRLIRKLPKQVLNESAEEDKERGAAVIGQLIERGVVAPKEPQTIVAMFRLLLHMRLHKDQLGPDLFDKAMDQLIEYVAEGITKRP